METNDRVHLMRAISNKLFFGLLIIIVVVGVFIYLTYINKVYVSTPFCVFLIGSIGGFVSTQRKLLTFSVEDLALLQVSFVNLYLYPFVGGLLAVILYLIFLSEFIICPLFPLFKLDQQSSQMGVVFDFLRASGSNYKDWAKLAFWSFVAGYSEDFTLSLIDKCKKAALSYSKDDSGINEKNRTMKS